MGIFGLRIEKKKKIVMFGIPILGFAVMQKIVQNNKNQIWDQKCLIWVF